MLIIRDEQIEKFKPFILAENLKLLTGEFEALYPEQFRTMGAEASAAFILGAVNRAISWGITGYGDITDLMDVMLRHGTEFASTPEWAWAKDLLTSDELSGPSKMILFKMHLDRL